MLSGFLISQIIAGDLDAGKFSIAKFYERRIRRIVPALVFVCAICTVAAAVILFPGELRTYASSLLAAVFSVSNVWFAANTSYFDPAAATQPLLHTWSLGVEEQFYMFFPLLLSVVFRFDRRRVPLLIWSLIAVSLALGIALTPGYSRSSYFLIHTRTWELLTGAVLGLGLVPSPISKGQRETAAALGLIGIATAVLVYTGKTPFPGSAALVPCIGTALIIWAGGQTVVGRMLSIRPMVFVGLISYSLYLWHWPLIVFAKLILVQPFTLTQQVLLTGAAFGLSVLTWHFVERPFRRRSHSTSSQTKVFAAGGAGLGALAASAVAFLVLNGWPGRFPEDILGLEAAAQDWSPKRVGCHFDGSLSGDFDKSCVLGAPVEPSIIVYGDSHGAELSVALASLAETRNESVRELTASGCPPALNFTYPDRPECPAYNAKILERLTALPPKTIILTANAVAWTDEYSKQFFGGLQGMLHALSKAGHRVILMGQIPPHPNQLPVPATLARRAEFGKKPANYVFRPEMQKLQELDAKLEKIAQSEGARYVSLVQALCNKHGCKADMDGKVLYFDDNHMSVAGQKVMAAKLLAPILWPEPIASATKNGSAAALP